MSPFSLRRSLRAHLPVLIAVLCLAGCPHPPAQAVPPRLTLNDEPGTMNKSRDISQLPLAVVRIPSHGASATIIHTEKDRTILLGCAHAYEGANKDKPMEIDIPLKCGWRHLTQDQGFEAEIKLLVVDESLDLSLVEIHVGPLPHVAPVPYRQYPHGRHLLSVGYDGMNETAVRVPTDILAVTPRTTFTRQRPIPGRSGGALLDLDHGFLIGVVQGYEIGGQKRGLYVSLPAILKFLGQQGWEVEKQDDQKVQGRGNLSGPALLAVFGSVAVVGFLVGIHLLRKFRPNPPALFPVREKGDRLPSPLRGAAGGGVGVKAGWKTSEFWIALISQTLTLLVLAGALTRGDEDLLADALGRMATAITALVSSSAIVWQYIRGRIALKSQKDHSLTPTP